MDIVYVTSTYPSLTETFVARAIERVVKAGNNVTICILKPFIPETAAKAMRVENVLEIRFTYNFISLLINLLKIIITKPNRFFKCVAEVMMTSFRKPSKAHYIAYLFMSVVWFAGRRELKYSEYVHCHFLHTESIATRWLSILLNVPYGLNAHIVKIRFDRHLIGQVVRNASVCVGDTRETFSLLKKLGNQHPTFVRNGIDVSNIAYIAPDLRRKGNEIPVILAVGSLLHVKGFHVLIAACAQLNKMGFEFMCRIIGEGVERKYLERLISDNDLTDKVFLPGAVTISELYTDYKKATVLVMPSVPSPVGTDGLPTVIIEAMASGLPVIGSNHAAIPELVLHGETGIIVEPDEPNSLAMAIKEMLANEVLYHKYAVNGREMIEKEFDINKNSARIIQLMEDVIGAKNLN